MTEYKKFEESDFDVIEAIRKSWSADTAFNPSIWSEDRPETGQCAITSLLVNDIFGFKIIRGIATLPDGSTVSHYWNTDMDMTLDQFPPGTVKSEREGPKGDQVREYIMANDDVKRRYEILKKRFRELEAEAGFGK